MARESLTLRLARDLLRKCPTGGSELVLAAAVSSFERSERWREAVELSGEPWIQSIVTIVTSLGPVLKCLLGVSDGFGSRL